MSVVNGQQANQTTFNDAFVSRIAPVTDTQSKLGLKNDDFVDSGPHVENIQKATNLTFDTVGIAGETDTNSKVYATPNFIADGDSHKVAIEKIDDQLKQTQDDLDAAEVIVADHETRLVSAEATIADHETRLDSAELTIADHETRLDAAELTIADHETRLDAAELTIADHETRLDSLETGDMTIGGNKTFSGDVVIQGDLEVQGTVTSINSTNTEVADQNILVNKGGTDGSSEGAGIDVERPSGNAGIRFDSTLASKFKIGLVSALHEILVSGVAQVVSGLKTFVDGINTDTIGENTLDNGVVVDGVTLKDGLVSGRNVATDGSNLDSHIADTLNPHSTTAAQVGADPTGTAAAAVLAHEAALDPHPQYLTNAEGDLLFDALGAAQTVQDNLGTHIGDTNNPHATTAAQVGLGDVLNGAQLLRAANDFVSFTEKTVPVADDVLLIEDSADAGAKKFVKISNLPGGGGGGGGSKTIEMKINGIFGGTPALNSIDGFWIAPANIQITNVFMYQETQGSGGTTTLDVKVKPFGSGSFTSIFLTLPAVTPSAGALAWCGVGDTVTGFTAPVLTTTPFAVAAKSALRMDLIGAQTGSPEGVGLVIVYEEI